MSGARKAARLLMPWAGLILAGTGWALEHQIGSDLSFSDCAANGPLQTGLLGLAALALAVVGALLSWRAWRGGGGDDKEGRSFVAMICMLAALLFGVAIILGTAAAFILPPCFA